MKSIKPNPHRPAEADLRAYAKLPTRDSQHEAQLLLLLHHAGFGAMCVERAVIGIDRLLQKGKIAPGLLEACRATYALWGTSKSLRREPTPEGKRARHRRRKA